VAHALTYAEANPAQRALRRLAASGPGSWLFAHVMHHFDRTVYRATGGRHTSSSLLSGLPVVMLTTTGARTGVRRSVPVIGFSTDDGFVVIASNWGQGAHPGWYHNLRAHPEGEVTVDGVTRRFRAVEAQGEMRARIWREGLRVFPGWSHYERQVSGRSIGVFALDLDGRPASTPPAGPTSP
jgi:deazaflavin-dependent oxidoreductase (nitroreductase family)